MTFSERRLRDAEVMPVSRGRKPKQKKLKLPPTQLQRQMPQAVHKSLWQSVRDHPIFWAIGVIAALIAIYDPVARAFAPPDISADATGDVLAPFASPFTVKNQSWAFAMSAARMSCDLDQVVTSRLTFRSVILIGGRTATVDAGREGAFRCLLGDSPSEIVRITPFDLKSAHIFLSIEYTILWVIPRKSIPTEFTWYTRASPPHWIRGVIAN